MASGTTLSTMNNGHRILQRSAAVLLGLALAGFLFNALRSLGGRELTKTLSPEESELLIQELAQRVDGGFDTHNDPDVGRILLPGIEKTLGDQGFVRSSSWGLREREISLKKRAGELRVVLLGDSLVFGKGVAAEDRMGVVLQRMLREHEGGDWEVFHVGISGWNITNEVAFLRRRLHSIQPDFVIHVTTLNDLDDSSGVRGFGGMSFFTPEHRERANGRVDLFHPYAQGTAPAFNFLLFGEDHESRSRLSSAQQKIESLAYVLRESSIPYVSLVHWMDYSGWIVPRIIPESEHGAVYLLDGAFSGDSRNWVSKTDRHWNIRAMEAIGRALYEVVRLHGSGLGGKGIAQRKDAEESFRTVLSKYSPGEAAPRPNSDWLRQVDTRFDVSGMTGVEGYHVYGGIDEQGRVAPFASLALKADLAQEISVRIIGERLGHVSLARGLTRVLVEGELVGEFALSGGEPIDVVFECPASIKGELLNIVLLSTDWVHDVDDPQQCVAFLLRSVEVGGP